MNQTPADPSACKVTVARDTSGAVACIGIILPPDRPMVATEYWGEDEVSRLIRLAREEEDSDPHSDRLPSDRAFICAALRDLGIPILGEQDDDDDGAESEARIQHAMAFGLEPPEEPPHRDPQDEEAPWDRRDREAAEREWRDAPLLVMVADAEPSIAMAGEFCDANREEEGLHASVCGLIRGASDWVRFGGGAAPEVLVTRMDEPMRDAEVKGALRSLLAKAEALDALLAAAREAEAFMAGFEGDEAQDPPVDARLAALRAAIAKTEGASPAPVTAPEPITIGITLEGGLVQGVWSEQDAALRHVRLVVVDYDTEGADEDQVTREEPDCDGAILGFWSVEHAEGTADGPRLIRAAEVGGQS